jgi:hypothetical protein
MLPLLASVGAAVVSDRPGGNVATGVNVVMDGAVPGGPSMGAIVSSAVGPPPSLLSDGANVGRPGNGVPAPSPVPSHVATSLPKNTSKFMHVSEDKSSGQ